MSSHISGSSIDDPRYFPSEDRKQAPLDYRRELSLMLTRGVSMDGILNTTVAELDAIARTTRDRLQQEAPQHLGGTYYRMPNGRIIELIK